MGGAINSSILGDVARSTKTLRAGRAALVAAPVAGLVAGGFLGPTVQPGSSRKLDTAVGGASGLALSGALFYALRRPALHDVAAVTDAARGVARLSTVTHTYYPRGIAVGGGTGWFVSEHELVTNRHVIDDADSIKVHTADGQHIAGTVVARDYDLDLALVRIPKPLGVPLRLADSMEPNQAAFAVGHPLGAGQRSSALTRIATDPGYARDAAYHGQSANGSSGSPLVNDAGEVVGTLHSGYAGDDGRRRVIAHDQNQIRSFLYDALN